jgi:mono/diheme cytochrome c family protein
VTAFLHLRRILLLAIALGAALGGCAHRGVFSRPQAAEKAQPAAPVAAAAVNTGKGLFMARCGSCHNERGDKPLRTGPPLNQRKLSREVIAEAVNGRLKNRTPAERDAVIEYISGLYVGSH